MTEPTPDLPPELAVDRAAFRDVVRHPEAHAVVLAQYRVGEHAGVVALDRLLEEMEPEGKLRRAMEIHHRDEARHSQLFGDWILRLGVEPPPLPTDLEGFFSNSPEEYRDTRRLLDSLPVELRRILVFAGINAVERLAYSQFEHHLLALDRPEDVANLEGVMAEEKFHLTYVEAELDRQSGGPNGALVTQALEQARVRFAQFRQTREDETRQAIERLLGASRGDVMEFGIFYEHQIPRPWGDRSEQQLFQEALDQVELADKLGIDYAWEVEHHFLEEYSHSSAPEVFLAACSQRTKRIRLGHGITLMPPGYNSPARVAERIATLDLVSNGRVEWGTGESSSRLELEGFGINYMEKRDMWEEAVRETARMMAMEPYPGYQGKYFSMPPRNVVPKPVQRPHPPLWVACSNRDTIKLAARLGIGALTFAFIDPADAKYWVEEYYETFKKECTPIGRAVNPNIAMVTGFMCHEDSARAVAQGLEGFKFFGFALAHYYITGTHRPGRLSVWEEFKKAPPFPQMPTGGIGNPDEVRANLEKYEEVGVDQVVFIQQGGNNRHEDICDSLNLFAGRVMPDFKARHDARARKKAAELAPYVEKALARMAPLGEMTDVPEIDSYPVMLQKAGVDISQLMNAPGQRLKQGLGNEKPAGVS